MCSFTSTGCRYKTRILGPWTIPKYKQQRPKTQQHGEGCEMDSRMACVENCFNGADDKTRKGEKSLKIPKEFGDFHGVHPG